MSDSGGGVGPTSRTVFIVGPARSGTSLLFKALCLHGDSAWISNWVRRFPAVPQLAVLNRSSRWMPGLRRQAWFDGGGNAYVYGTRRPLPRRMLAMPAEGEPVFRRCGFSGCLGGQGEASAPDLRRLRETFRTIRRASGGRVLLNKRIANNQRIPLLYETFPEAQFVFMVRDGRAVATSLARVDWWLDSALWWYGDTPRGWAAADGDPWDACARNWVEDLRAAERGLETVPAEQRMQVRYEDLVNSPIPTLQRVAMFAGLMPSASWQQELERLSFPDRNESWRHLDAAVVARISDIQRPELERYGYLDSASSALGSGASTSTKTG